MNAPAIYQGSVFTSDTSGGVRAVSMQTGKPVWFTNTSKAICQDNGSLGHMRPWLSTMTELGFMVGNIYVHGGYKPTHISLRNHLEGRTFAYRICRKSQAQHTCEEQVLSLSHGHCRALVFLDYVYIYIIMFYIYTNNTCLCFWASMSVKGRKGIQEGNVASWPLISPSHSLVNGAWLAREYLVASNFLCTCSWSFSNICDWLNTPKIGQNHQKLWS